MNPFQALVHLLAGHQQPQAQQHPQAAAPHDQPFIQNGQIVHTGGGEWGAGDTENIPKGAPLAAYGSKSGLQSPGIGYGHQQIQANQPRPQYLHGVMPNMGPGGNLGVPSAAPAQLQSFNPGATPLQNSGFGPAGNPQIRAFNSPQQGYINPQMNQNQQLWQ
jgi:hypothetical protein